MIQPPGSEDPGGYPRAVREGRVCVGCGVLFASPHGYPVVCLWCAREDTTTGLRRQGLEVARHGELAP